jgi:hypothetical protein
MALNWHRKIWVVDADNGTTTGVPDPLFKDGASNRFWLDPIVGETEQESEDYDSLVTVTRAGFTVGFEPHAMEYGWEGLILVPRGERDYDPGDFDQTTNRLEAIVTIDGTKRRIRLFIDETSGEEVLVIRLGIPLTLGSEGLATARPE